MADKNILVAAILAALPVRALNEAMNTGLFLHTAR